MNTALNSSDIIELVKTKSEASLFITSLNSFAQALYNTKTNIPEKMNECFPYSQKEQLMALLQQNNINVNDIHELQEYIFTLIKYIEKLPVMIIHIAFEPKDETIQAISDWILRDTSHLFILDIFIDKTLVAGATFALNGVYKDYSIKKTIEEKLKPENIAKLLN